MTGRGGRGGRPRDPVVDRAILDATRTLLLRRGYRGLRIAEVAERAGVTQPTVRLRWKTKAELVHDAVFTDADKPVIPDTGTFAGDLRAAIDGAIAVFTRPTVRAALLGLSDDVREHPALGERLRARLYGPAVDGFDALLDRAVARGELEPSRRPDPATLMEAITGTIVFRVLFAGRDVGSLADDLAGLLVGDTPTSCG